MSVNKQPGSIAGRSLHHGRDDYQEFSDNIVNILSVIQTKSKQKIGYKRGRVSIYPETGKGFFIVGLFIPVLRTKYSVQLFNPLKELCQHYFKKTYDKSMMNLYS